MSYSGSIDEVRRLVDNRVEEEVNALKARLGSFDKTPVDKLLLYVKMRLAIKSLVRDEGLLEYLDRKLAESLGLPWVRQPSEQGRLIESFQLDERVYRRLSKSRYVTARSLFEESSSRREILTYILMRKKGVLEKHPNGSLVVNKRELSRYEPDKEYELELGDLARYLREIPSTLWSKVLTSELLGKASTEELVSLAKRFYGFNQRVDQRLVDELRRRVSRGWMPSISQVDSLGDLVEEVFKGVKTRVPPHLLPYIDDVNAYIDGREEKVARELERLFLGERWTILRSIKGRLRNTSLYQYLNPFSLMELKSLKGLDKPVVGKAMLGQAISSYMEFLLTRNESFRDYAVYIAERIDASMLEPRYKPILESIISGDEKKLLFLLSRESPFDALELISMKLREEYSRTGSLDPALVRRAIVIGLKLLNYMEEAHGFKHGVEKTSVRGRLDVRSTMYKWIRLDDELVFRRHRRIHRVIGVVDVSGSMARFSLWSILSLAVVLPVVSRIILFTDRVYQYNPPLKKTIPLLAGFLEKLYSEGFKGYTNISEALRQAGRVAAGTGSKTILLFSDLKQTIPGEEPWVVAKELVNRGLNIVIIAPRDVEEELANRYKSVGCDLIVVENPENIPNILKRRINLKNRV